MLRLALLFIYSTAAMAEFEIYLKEPNKIPLYAQETNVWCGAGSAQMMLEGFPNDVNHVYKQSYIWETIQDLKVEQGWYTDPDGLKNVMEELSGTTKWEAKCARSGSQSLMKLLVNSMATRQYPMSVLVYGSAHWIVIIGATTDKHPGQNASVTLQQIEAFDPWKAQHVLVTGSTWYQKYWYSPAASRGKWSGCYVAVHEVTPQFDATPAADINVVSQSSSGELISEKVAAEKASNSLSKVTRENESFKSLAKAVVQTPRLVRHTEGNYYLVPVGDKQTGPSTGAILINAYTGEFQGLSRFKETFTYLNEKQARARARTTTSGQWIFSPSEESRSPFHPVYRTEKDGAPVFVDQDGKVSSQLHALTPGS